MAVSTVPDWLRKRGGELKPGISAHTLFVMLDGKPQYRLDVRPAKGQYICCVTQTINGKRFDTDTAFPSVDAAIEGGLTALREKLGW